CVCVFVCGRQCEREAVCICCVLECSGRFVASLRGRWCPACCVIFAMITCTTPCSATSQRKEGTQCINLFHPSSPALFTHLRIHTHTHNRHPSFLLLHNTTA